MPLNSKKRTEIAKQLLHSYNCTTYQAPEPEEFGKMVLAYSEELNSIPTDAIALCFAYARKNIKPIPNTTEIYRAWREYAREKYDNIKKSKKQLPTPKTYRAEEHEKLMREMWQGFLDNGMEHLIPKSVMEKLKK